MAINTNGQFKTSDTAFATYLIVEGFLPSFIDYAQDRYTFSFAGDYDTLKKHEAMYIAGQARVDPATYHRVNRSVMRAINKRRQWGEG